MCFFGQVATVLHIISATKNARRDHLVWSWFLFANVIETNFGFSTTFETRLLGDIRTLDSSVKRSYAEISLQARRRCGPWSDKQRESFTFAGFCTCIHSR